MVLVARPVGAEPICTATMVDDMVELRWPDQGGRHIVRRNGKWLQTLPTGVTSFVDESAPDDASYIIRFRIRGVATDLDCVFQHEPAERVVHISIDGLRSDHVTAATMPVLHGLLGRSSFTLNARSDRTVTKTLPNHLSQLTGRPVAGPDGHGVEFNSNRPGAVHDFAPVEYVPSTFDVVHDHGGRTAAFVGKSKFWFINRSWNSDNGAPDLTGIDNGTDKIDHFKKGAPEWLVDNLLRQLTQADAEYVFFHIRTPDSAGHDFGWGSVEYDAAVADADELVAQILSGIETSPSLSRNTAVVIVADHGGPVGGLVHSDAANPENFTIPFIVHKTTWTSSVDLYDLNPDRREPLPDENPTEAIRTLDVANLVTSLLGYPPVNLDGPAALQVR